MISNDQHRKFYLNKIINHQDLGTVIVSIKGRSRIEKVWYLSKCFERWVGSVVALFNELWWFNNQD